MIPQIAGLTEQGIQDYIANIKYQISVQALWNDVAKSDHGKFLFAQLSKDLEFWRSQYSQIDSASPASSNLLSFIQGVEMAMNRIMSWLNESGKNAENLTNELESIGESLKLKQNQKIGLTLLPTGYVKKGAGK